eukprot:NODE_4309_length_479_cov_47.120930_g3701_i0.p1 GENE.NODE_4309_length_479_cov_47.120930_g3701_i0~~NODE_4309_length_479_cov_47.120930_g3701_i0.p1  ORF type:complete len:127 (+),score=27.70 NODE_4309_length_479_cov_47.120930_g3701_i0:54-383(+)
MQKQMCTTIKQSPSVQGVVVLLVWTLAQACPTTHKAHTPQPECIRRRVGQRSTNGNKCQHIIYNTALIHISPHTSFAAVTEQQPPTSWGLVRAWYAALCRSDNAPISSS